MVSMEIGSQYIKGTPLEGFIHESSLTANASKEHLLKTFIENLLIINQGQSNGFNHKANVEELSRLRELNKDAACRLHGMGAGEDVAMVIYGVNIGRTNNEEFKPTIVSKFPVQEQTVGIIVGQDVARKTMEIIDIKRNLLGRVFAGPKQKIGIVIVNEYYESKGEDDPLFRIAEKHRGIRGNEGVVTRVVQSKKAQELLFSGVANY